MVLLQSKKELFYKQNKFVGNIGRNYIIKITSKTKKNNIILTKVVIIFANIKNIRIFANSMVVSFEQKYLEELYTQGKSNDKKHWFQPQIIDKYVKVVNLMKQQENVTGLTKYGSLHYEKLHGDKEGFSSVRVNDQYRIEFIEETESGKQIATICSITELSNHYK